MSPERYNTGPKYRDPALIFDDADDTKVCSIIYTYVASKR